MSEVIQGTITAVSKKEVNTKRGPAMTYSFCLDGDTWCSNGFTALKVGKGDEVKVTLKGDRYNTVVSIDPVSVGSSTGGNTVRKPDNVQQAIIRQNALSHATAIVLASKEAKETRNDLVKEVIRLAKAFEAYADGRLAQVEDQVVSDEAVNKIMEG